MMKWSESYIEWCEIMHQEPNARDQIIFEAGAVFISIDIKHAREQKQLPPDIARIIEDIESINEHILMTSFDANSLRALAEYVKTGV